MRITGNLLLRAAWRDLRALRWRMVAVMLILGAGFGMYVGIYSAIDSLFASRDSIYRQADVAGFELRFSPEDSLNVPDWSDISGIRTSTARLLLPGNIELADGRRQSALLVGVDSKQPVNRLLPIQGLDLDSEHPSRAVIDRNLARHRGFTLGDTLYLNVGRDRLELQVGGVATSAEHLIDGADPSFFLPAKGSLGIVFVPLELMDERLGFRLINSVLFTGATPVSDLPETVRNAVLERAELRLNVEERLPLSRQFGHLFLNLDLNAFRIFTPAIVVIFAVSAVTVLFFLLHQWVAAQRRELGVLAALGYSPRRRVGRVLLPLAVIAVGGLVTGIGFGFILLFGFGHEYATAVGLPSPDLSLEPIHLATATAGLLVACMLGVLGPLHQILSVTPIMAVRNQIQLPPAGRGQIASGVQDLVWRHALRSVLRRRWASLMTVVAVAMALAPALSYFVSLRSFEQAVINGFSSDRWQYSVDFLSPVWDDELAELRGLEDVKSVDPIVRGATRFESGGKREGALLIGIDPHRALRRPVIMEGRPLMAGDTDALVMERKLADSLNLKLGDELVVDGRLGPEPARLVGIFSGALPGESFTTTEAARRWLDLEEQSTGVLIASTLDVDLTASLYRDSRIAKVTARKALVDEVVHHLHEISAIVYLAAAFSVGVALLFLYTSTAFAFLDREADFGLLDLLGFRRSRIAAMVRREVWLLGGAGVLLSVPLGYGLAHWLNGVLGDAWFAIPTTFNPVDPIALMLPAAVLLPLISRPVVRRIRAQDPALLVRRRSFG